MRLTNGDYDKQRTYADNPAEMATELESLGARRLHVVDLDGAKSRHIVNTATLEQITGRTNLVVDFGGGIKSEDDIERAFRFGASMVTVGSVAVADKALMQRWIDTYGAERIILGADVRDGRISVNGWKEDSQEEIADFLEYYINKGVTKVLAETRQALLDGASEVDMVVNISDVKNGDFEAVKEEIAALKEIVQDKILKVIIETCYLTEEEKIAMCKAVTEAGADYIKTSTGFGTAGATLEDIRLFKANIGPDVKMKAAGGVKTVEDMEEFLKEGCDRIGTSSAIKLIQGQKTSGY